MKRRMVMISLCLSMVFGGGAAFAIDDTAIRSISNGHVYDKHVVKQGEFPEITSKAQFYTLIKSVVSAPMATKNLLKGRVAFWSDPAATIVIYDAANKDKGTAFRPQDGRAHFDRQQDVDTNAN